MALALPSANAQQERGLDALIRDYLAERGATAQLAKQGQLVRRYALDLTGILPSAQDLAACEGKSPSEVFDYFRAKGPMPHTRGEAPYVYVNLLKDADHFLFSNSTQFSQVAHLREYQSHLRALYADGASFQDFARWALESQMFLNRFPSAADRANAAFFLFLGRDSLASEVPVGNLWNGWALKNASIPATQAESNPDYHVYTYQPALCGAARLCEADLWGKRGSSPQQAIDWVVSSHLFAEATVDRYWSRYIGTPLPGSDFPELRRALVRGLVQSKFNLNWLIKEITTSAAYTQEMTFR